MLNSPLLHMAWTWSRTLRVCAASLLLRLAGNSARSPFLSRTPLGHGICRVLGIKLQIHLYCANSNTKLYFPLGLGLLSDMKCKVQCPFLDLGGDALLCPRPAAGRNTSPMQQLLSLCRVRLLSGGMAKGPEISHFLLPRPEEHGILSIADHSDTLQDVQKIKVPWDDMVTKIKGVGIALDQGN